MASSLWIGTTGLAVSEKQLAVIGNNLANSNTAGFKSSDTSFASMLSQSASSGSQQVGQGVSVSSIGTSFAQGSFQTTGTATDLSIDGDGFFILKNTEGSSSYTRAGGFLVDESGLLSDINGNRVQGYKFTDGVEVKAMVDLDLQNVMSKPVSTSLVKMGLTLDSQTATDGTGTFDCSQVVFDSLGTEHTLNATFRKTAGDGTWDITYKLDGLTSAVTNASLKGIQFGSDGTITHLSTNGTTWPTTVSTSNITNQTFQITLSNGATIGSTTGTVTWDFESVEARLKTITSYATTSRVNAVSNNGYSSGTLTGLTVDDAGVVQGMFTNGKRQDLARVLLASFANNQGLSKVGSNFVPSGASGDAVINYPGSGGVGTLRSSSLEQSNTDVAAEFIKMIMAQRAYQANAKVITSSDQMLQQLMAIKQ